MKDDNGNEITIPKDAQVGDLFYGLKDGRHVAPDGTVFWTRRGSVTEVRHPNQA